MQTTSSSTSPTDIVTFILCWFATAIGVGFLIRALYGRVRLGNSVIALAEWLAIKCGIEMKKRQHTHSPEELKDYYTARAKSWEGDGVSSKFEQTPLFKLIWECPRCIEGDTDCIMQLMHLLVCIVFVVILIPPITLSGELTATMYSSVMWLLMCHVLCGRTGYAFSPVKILVRHLIRLGRFIRGEKPVQETVQSPPPSDKRSVSVRLWNAYLDLLSEGTPAIKTEEASLPSSSATTASCSTASEETPSMATRLIAKQWTMLQAKYLSDERLAQHIPLSKEDVNALERLFPENIDLLKKKGYVVEGVHCPSHSFCLIFEHPPIQEMESPKTTGYYLLEGTIHVKGGHFYRVRCARTSAVRPAEMNVRKVLIDEARVTDPFTDAVIVCVVVDAISEIPRLEAEAYVTWCRYQ